LRPISLPYRSGDSQHIAISSSGKTLLAVGGPTIDTTLVTVVTGRRAHRPITLRGNQGETCIAVSPDGAMGYLFRTLPRFEVVPIDVATNKPLRAIKLRSQNYTVRTGLCTVAVAPNGRTAYVQVGRYVAPLDLVTGRALRPIKLPAVSADFEPQLSIDPDGAMAYAIGPDSVFPVDLATHKTLPAVNFAANFYGFCLSFSPKGGTVLVGVANAHNAGKLLLIHAATGKTGKVIKVPGTCSSIAELGTPSTSSSALSP
jgi:DNA-binding beta-propeller fold protein YncE